VAEVIYVPHVEPVRALITVFSIQADRS